MVRVIGKVAWEETKCFFGNSKLILLLFELIFLCETYLIRVKQLCEMSNMKVSFFEPYLLISSGDMYFLAIPLVFLILLSGFPSKHSYNYFTLIRISKFEWLLGELLFVLISVVGYMFILGVGLVLYMGRWIQFENRWSDYMLKFHEQFPDLFKVSEDYFLDVRMMTHGSPMQVFFHSVLLMLCMLVSVALIQITFSLLHKKYLGMLLTIGLTLSSALSIYGSGNVKWIFPMTHANYAVHFHGFRAEKYMGIEMSYLYFGLMIMILVVIDLVLAKKMDMEA